MKNPNILAQLLSGAESTLYTVPNGSRCLIQEITFCNTAGGSSSFSLSFCPQGKINHPTDWVYDQQALAGNTTFQSNLLANLGPGDLIRVAGNNIAITLYGQVM